MSRKAREIGDVRGKSCGRPRARISSANPRRRKCSVVRASVGVGLRIERGVRLVVDHHRAHAAAAEFVGQHQSAGPATDDQHLGGVGQGRG
jgi:hypothetical protein